MKRDVLNIALLGATSHIAKGLIVRFLNSGEFKLYLYGRSPDRIKTFLKENGFADGCAAICGFEKFPEERYSAVINCVGLGDPAKIKSAGAEIFNIIETYDNLSINYIKKNPSVVYIHFSSGAVYGRSFEKPADEASEYKIKVNYIDSKDFYALAKLNAEGKHRAYCDLNIVDLRIFSYYTRFIDLNAKYLLSELVSSLIERKEFVTTSSNIIRDYVHSEDLFFLVKSCLKKERINDAFDVYSLKPVSKMEILDLFCNRFGLKVVFKDEANITNATGIKDMYYSINRKAENLGYKPKYPSLETIEAETKELLKR